MVTLHTKINHTLCAVAVVLALVILPETKGFSNERKLSQGGDISEGSHNKEYMLRRRAMKRSINRDTISLLSGGSTKTSVKLISDVVNLLENQPDRKFRVIPVIGRGGGQNILDILFLKGIDMGIVHESNLKLLKSLDPLLFRDLEQRLRYIAKLHNYEFLIIANREIKNIRDLKGKKVNFGKKFSQSDIIGRNVFSLLNLQVSEYNMDEMTAIEHVKKRKLTATVLLDVSPEKTLSGVKKEDGLHILSISPKSVGRRIYSKLAELYLPAILTKKKYGDLISSKSVTTLASSSLLVTYNWAEESPKYQNLRDFVYKLFYNFQKLRSTPNHARWGDINLGAEAPQWKRFKPAVQWVQTNLNKNLEVNMDLIRAAFIMRLDDLVKVTDLELELKSRKKMTQKQLFYQFLDAQSRHPGQSMSKDEKNRLYHLYSIWSGRRN